jgi:hypothetical protein
MIPKIIWQTHEWSYEDLPENFLRVIKTWKNLNPEWQHRYVNAVKRAADVKEYDETLYRYYLLADKITQADIWRYIIVYKHGGVYADMDSICTMPLDYMIDKHYKDEDLISLAIMIDYQKPKINGEYDSSGVNNSNFAAIKNSKIMKLIIDNIIEKYKKITLLDVFNSSEIGHEISGRIRCFWLGYRQYSDIVMQNQDDVCFNFEASIHSQDFKQKFDTDYMINDYGKQIPYFSFVIEKNLKLY